ncbi:protein THEMIS2 [Periophthalmus magnuspinnatus]|uniref:protein THEMIS2 n=1 Tax=Periophthalmus magnuspinnatus TaxID=409849 RepID=UPI00145B0984|nr:protein THEMIS2 [Periophthalmus magnuspinnatus]
MAGITLPLEEYCASLDGNCLPKILQVCSGVYFQGSIYEISGSEVCFSTGDLIKVIGIELQSVSCEDVSNSNRFELPIQHTGLFKIVPEQMPYSTVDEMMRLRPIGLESSLPFTFTSRTKITIGDFTLSPGKELTVRCFEQLEDGNECIRCFVRGQQEASAEVCIPLSTKGEFYECESEECFSLSEIMTSSSLRSRRFCFANTTKSKQPLLFTPVYQIHAIMNLRKNILKFPSSLEVDVIDVTDICKADFVTPLNLTEILSQPDENFPAVVEILEGPGSRAMFKCNWLSELKTQNKLIFHKKGSTALVLISNLKSRKAQQYFLVSQHYAGRFKRRPREFSSVYEVYAASVNVPGLKVSVTRNCEEIEEEGVPALSVGEHLEIVRCERMELPNAQDDKQRQTVEALLCYRQADEDDEEEEEINIVGKEEMYLPMYMQGNFVEVLADNKKYKLKDLGKEFSLPMDVKVVTKDSELENDPLATSNLRIEAAMVEPVIQASFLNCPGQCFDIPSKWLSMSVYFTNECLPWPRDHPPKCRVETVTEVTDEFLYEFRKQTTADVTPPPRPPKRNVSTSKSIKKSKKKSKNKAETAPSKELADLTLSWKKRPPAPPAPDDDEHPPVVPPKTPTTPATTTRKAQPNTYVKMQDSIKKAPLKTAADVDVDSEHDYETVEEFTTVIKKAQESVFFFK